ncbi:hypothetical protein LMG19282_04787 [Cupriavidus campinensis]|nr:hypothetical protein LMG19282_04787 [Cupriavidus campinensis]
MAHADQRGAAIGRDIDPIIARFIGHEGEVRRIDFHPLALRQGAHAQLQRALGELDLCGVVVEIEDAGGGGAAQPHRGGAGMHFGPAARIDPEPVAGGHGPVQADGRPLVRAGRREADATGHVSQRGDAGRRIGILPVRRQRVGVAQDGAVGGALRVAGRRVILGLRHQAMRHQRGGQANPGKRRQPARPCRNRSRNRAIKGLHRASHLCSGRPPRLGGVAVLSPYIG